MSRVFRSTLVAASLTAAALLVGSTAAYADDTTTKLSTAEMTAALKTVATASTTAAKPGWRADMAVAAGSVSGAGIFAVNPAGGVALTQFRYGSDGETTYTVHHKGTYEYFNDATSVAAVKMMGRASVRYVFTPNKTLNLTTYVNETLPVPAAVLGDGVGPGTKTVHDDGTADYAYSYTDEEEGADVAMTVHVDTAGVMTTAAMDGFGMKTTLTYTYGAPKLTVPASVDAATLKKAKAYLAMATRVKTAATNGAAHTRTAAKGKTVKVASLRTIVRKDAAAVNRSAGVAMVKVSNIAGGARVYATNPWTHKTVAYTVKASGKKVVVKLA